MTLEIDWSTIDPKYRWAARDARGGVHVYVNRPMPGGRIWSYKLDEFMLVRVDAADPNWRNTLTMRPAIAAKPLAHQEVDVRSHEVPFGQLERHAQLALYNAWLDGATIECSYNGTTFVRAAYPLWTKTEHYRIAPPPPPAPKTKPSIDWSHVAPQWRYLARDVNGSLWLFEQAPRANDAVWRGRRMISAQVFAALTPGDCDWKDSLVERPED